MSHNIVVLTDFSLAAERARAYAAVLAAPLQADLHLVHVYSPTPITTEYGLVLPVMDPQYAPETQRSLQQVAKSLPVAATAEVLEADWPGAIGEALDKYRPLLVVAGLTETEGWFSEWFSNRSRPLAAQTGYPLLLVPEHLPDAALRLPQRLLLAIEDRPFQLEPPAQAVAALLDVLALDIVAVTVLPPEENTGGWEGLRAAQKSGLAACMPRCGLHKVQSELPASGVLEAVSDLHADVLALLDQGHGWVHKLFRGSVIDHVLRHSRVPVLLLAARLPSPEPAPLPNWVI
ncbi:universal stress protein [Hymenobacter properus]|uniref:Universal stress protein n=1 Tax=Hymenobacter properus TaxID=2791026 RepID=A0A931FLH6_9BACT|nr:universal stress protein [Hymenobacter properus]MBF9142875.1 universal stress protein [Hymenobacter properus]MBR7721682.1 universal stress protein [Microvirga sp. SRT04]